MGLLSVMMQKLYVVSSAVPSNADAPLCGHHEGREGCLIGESEETRLDST